MRPLKVLIVAALSVGSLAAQNVEFFESTIRPVLAEKCVMCHSSSLDTPMGGLRLDSQEGMLTGGASGPVLVAGDPDNSLIVEALTYKDAALKMPPTGKLSDAVIADFRTWIQQGAVDPRTEQTSAAGPSAKPKQNGPGTPIAEGRKWWAFQPLHEVLAPQPQRQGWSQRKIDPFVLAKLEENGLEPSPEADKRTLIRRAYQDLIGLPPSYEEVEAFANDSAPDAYEKLVDGLLASPRYGERWGRHWLDVARWAEDHPTREATNQPHPFAWRYRDWVIEAFNKDIPYDQFIRMQFAADLLPGFKPDDMRALGYIGNSPMYHKDARISRDVTETLASDEWDERLDAVSRGLLGMTVACARCHDHKFDPITNKDYYAMAGVFASLPLVKRPIVEIDPARADKLVWDYERLVRHKGQLGNLGEPDTIADQVHPIVAKMREDVKTLEEELGKDPTPMTHAVIDAGIWIDGNTPTVTWIDVRPGQPRDLPIFIRGNVANTGEIVPRRFLEVFSEGEPEPYKQGAGRLELADNIVGRAGPLAARVWVNRVWGHHFGTYIVGTPSDFGTQGHRPTHPELLDDLAARFVENGWSLKWLHKEIMLSATYMQFSQMREDADTADPTNQWMWRLTPRRLDVEAWRDSVIQASGELDLYAGGPSEDATGEVSRRTVYSQIRRSGLNPMLQLYDFPDASQHQPERQETTTPLQQLFVMNSSWMERQAASLTALDQGIADGAARIEAMYRRTFSRDATQKEIDLGLAFLKRRQAEIGREPWEEYAQVLLGSNELIYFH
ncbi:MAG: PSD1 and planctomycete cytochrome C domain-containing protein [Acidobacteria bacterium]|nr:PSD1 and planctomycete cytochrome C domain-containing protein [Acidobacteriota bacterium]MDA1235972.1 PSD1 and planctomycete cytochrome C domain-containing protein [Acidobacteriota bacterium]